MKKTTLILLVFFIVSFVSGCAYRFYFGHYVGVNGPSIRLHPDVHAGVTQDSECLGCHDPERDPSGPPTTHAYLTGCLKCHDDEI